MSRNSLATGDTYGKLDKNERWVASHFLDEYNSSSYNDQPAGQNRLNAEGAVYHAWNIAALLKFFPARVVAAGGIFRQITHLDQQGLEKLRSDWNQISKGSSLENLLLSY